MILKLKISPRPLTGAHREAVELHFEQRSSAGNRSFPQPSHFWTIRRPARAPSKNSRISGVIAGIGLLNSGIAVLLIYSLDELAFGLIERRCVAARAAIARFATNATAANPARGWNEWQVYRRCRKRVQPRVLAPAAALHHHASARLPLRPGSSPRYRRS